MATHQQPALVEPDANAAAQVERRLGEMVFASDDGEWLIVHEHVSPFVANS